MEKVFQFISNHWLLVTAFVIALIALFILEARGKGLGGKKSLSPHQATRLINSEKAVVVDIRDAKAYQKGHITNAINIPAMELDKNLKRLEQYKQHPLIIVCESGQKSGYFMTKLRKQGYENIYVMTGGMNAWKNASMPVIK